MVHISIIGPGVGVANIRRDLRAADDLPPSSITSPQAGAESLGDDRLQNSSVVGVLSEIAIVLTSSAAIAAFSRVAIEHIRNNRTKLTIKIGDKSFDIDSRSSDFDSTLSSLENVLRSVAAEEIAKGKRESDEDE